MAFEFSEPSISGISEPRLVERLVRHPDFFNLLANFRGIPRDVTPITRVDLGGLPGSPEGDIDLLLVPQGEPCQATAIQIKRVKISHGSFSKGKPNGLRGLRKGKRQANLLARLGFWQVYFYVLVVIDSRSQNTQELSFSGLSRDLAKEVDNSITPEGLDDGVGLVRFDFIQPMDWRPLTAGSNGFHLVRPARSIEQREAITEWVASKLA